jgi:hypothetical protein
VSAPDRNPPYLTILAERKYGNAMHLHAGLARWGVGVPFCDDHKRFWEFPLAAGDPDFALHRRAGWRHRRAEAWLELNRGCQTCLATLYEVGRELGYPAYGAQKESSR